MYLEVSLECLDISEKGLDKSTLADSVLTDDTNSVSLGEDRSACIEEWLLHTDADFWFFYDLDLFELFFSAFCEACT